MMFVVVQVHGLRVNVGFYGRVVVGQRGNFVCHSVLSSSWRLMQGNEKWFQNSGRSAIPHPEIIIVVREGFGCAPEAKSQERKAKSGLPILLRRGALFRGHLLPEQVAVLLCPFAVGIGEQG